MEQIKSEQEGIA